MLYGPDLHRNPRMSLSNQTFVFSLWTGLSPKTEITAICFPSAPVVIFSQMKPSSLGMTTTSTELPELLISVYAAFSF